jgi:hypothetical protein
MRKAFVIALVLLGLSAAPAAALEIKNVTRTFGAMGGAQPDNKVLPLDVLSLAYQIEKLTMEADTGFVAYIVKLEVSDSKNKVIFKRETPQRQHLALGKAQVAERAQVVIGAQQPPGKYSLRVTVTDQGGKAKGGDSKFFTYDFQVLPPDFGLIHAVLPAVAWTAQEISAYCQLVGMARNSKTKIPDVELRMRVFDEAGKPTLPKPFVSQLQKILPNPKDAPEFDITKEKVIPLPFPLALTRPGRFTIEIEAYDRIAKKTARVRFPLQVLEPSAIQAK